jgi:hypothetical protein
MLTIEQKGIERLRAAGGTMYNKINAMAPGTQRYRDNMEAYGEQAEQILNHIGFP